VVLDLVTCSINSTLFAVITAHCDTENFSPNLEQTVCLVFTPPVWELA